MVKPAAATIVNHFAFHLVLVHFISITFYLTLSLSQSLYNYSYSFRQSFACTDNNHSHAWPTRRMRIVVAARWGKCTIIS